MLHHASSVRENYIYNQHKKGYVFDSGRISMKFIIKSLLISNIKHYIFRRRRLFNATFKNWMLCVILLVANLAVAVDMSPNFLPRKACVKDFVYFSPKNVNWQLTYRCTVTDVPLQTCSKLTILYTRYQH